MLLFVYILQVMLSSRYTTTELETLKDKKYNTAIQMSSSSIVSEQKVAGC